MKYLLTFSYDGSKFHGLERQKDVKTIQGTLEEKISAILDEKICIKASGRTDRYVHAIAQTAHFDTEKRIPKDFLKQLNEVLKEEMVVKSIKKVSKDFHARFSVKKKTYRYIINLDRENRNAMYEYTSYYPLDIKKMKQASLLFLGTHDFRNFISGTRDDYTTHIFKINIRKKKNKITLEFTGTGFYRYMVRHLTGALYDVGRGKITNEIIEIMLQDKETKKQVTVMPANGLYLVSVKY